MHLISFESLIHNTHKKLNFLLTGWATTYFPQTPLMSSYLLSMAAGHFASLQTVSETGVLVRAWAWTGMERYAEVALKVKRCFNVFLFDLYLTCLHIAFRFFSRI